MFVISNRNPSDLIEQAAVVVPVIAIAAVEAAVQTIAGIDVTSSVNKTTLPVLSVSIDEAALNSEPNHTTSDVPERPWTPSYSVTQQGPGLSHQDEDKAESQPVGKASVSNDSEVSNLYQTSSLI